MVDIAIKGVGENQLHEALDCIEHFAKKYTLDRRGHKNGVGYSTRLRDGETLYVYQTEAGQIVCRGTRQ